MKRRLIPLFVIAIIAVVSLIVMLLWNALIPVLFSGPVLTYLQAVGLLILTKILLFGGPGARGFHRYRRCGKLNRFDEMLKHLSDEEKEALRSKLEVKA